MGTISGAGELRAPSIEALPEPAPLHSLPGLRSRQVVPPVESSPPAVIAAETAPDSAQQTDTERHSG